MIIDLSTVDTTPGAIGLLAPETSFDGDAKMYRRQLLAWWENDPQRRQVFVILMRALTSPNSRFKPTLAGPYADALRSWLMAVDARHRLQAAGDACTP